MSAAKTRKQRKMHLSKINKQTFFAHTAGPFMAGFFVPGQKEALRPFAITGGRVL
jgi:hypothetical protein